VNNDDEYIGEGDFDSFFDNEAVSLDDDIFFLFRNQKHSLMKLGFVENCNSGGFIDSDYFKLTDKAKDEFLAEINLKEMPLKYGADYISTGDIQAKKLFYNEKTAKRIGELSLLLKEENFAPVRERLGGNGMRRGFVCLFYGPPGTGKTETVYQICRETGRDIMTVDISQTKSCWVGESEKLIKQVFDRYRGAVKSSALAPVLLFNEADAVIGKRLEVSRSVDNMYNAIQNIILQEMENLDGILIATTNLTGNMDNAFERRFLYKVEFEKPALDVRTSIWQSVIPELSGEEAKTLADKFDFAGGQIENVARKRLAASIISGVKPSLDTLTAYCRDEALGGQDLGNRIGFGT
jgi:SpoVK/Ycf46/Vps4 family AAA+-type ATPase